MMSTVGFASTDLLEAKLKKVAADHNLVMKAADSVIALRRLTNAYHIIIGRLVERGLTKATIDTWIRGEEFQLDLATYWYGCDSGWKRMQRDERDWLNVFDREEELKTVPLLDEDFESIDGDGDVPVRVWNIEEDN